MPINYQPTTWNNEQDPPISADNLNHIEQGIKTTADRVDELVTVEANPSSSATDRLTGLEVDGTVYEVGGGHKVYTDDGTLLPQEPGLQFASGCVEDDAVNGKTVYIEMIRISQANYDTLKANGQLKPGAKYFIYDAQPVAVNASNLPYSSTQSTKQKIDELSTVDVLFLYKTCSSANVYEELTLPNNHKFSEYKMIAFYANHYGNVYGSLIEPIELFNTHIGTGNQARMYLDNNSSRAYSFYKSSDTKFMANMWTNDTQYRFSMYGIR